jgi:hypothetical protein
MAYLNLPALYHPDLVATAFQSVLPSVLSMQVRRKSIVASEDRRAIVAVGC